MSKAQAVVHRYRLEEGGAQRLEVEHDPRWREVVVRLDGNEIGSITDGQRRLRTAVALPMPDGTSLRLMLVAGLAGHELRVFRDGAPVPETARRLRALMRRAPIAVAVVAAGFGALAVAQATEALRTGPYLHGPAMPLFAALAAAFAGLAVVFAVRPNRLAYALGVPLGVVAFVALFAGAGLGPALSGSLIGVGMMFLSAVPRAGDAFRLVHGEQVPPRWATPRRIVIAFGAIGVVGLILQYVIPEMFMYAKKTKRRRDRLHLEQLVRTAQRYHDEHDQFPTGTTGPTPPLGTCCSPGGGGGGFAREGYCAPMMEYWLDPTWEALQFSVDDPDVFAYEYEAAPDGQSFTARAHGDTDCDGQYRVLEVTLGAGEQRTPPRFAETGAD
jgi:hypothetical protein